MATAATTSSAATPATTSCTATTATTTCSAWPATTACYGGAGDDLSSATTATTSSSPSAAGRATRHRRDGPDSFWVDAEGTETVDATFWEVLAGTATASAASSTPDHTAPDHAQTPSRELNGQNLLDPADKGGAPTNFSDRPLFGSTGRQGRHPPGRRRRLLLPGRPVGDRQDQRRPRIKQSVVDLGDGTYAVQFFRSGSPQFYRVDGDLPVSGTTRRFAKMGGENSNWVAIMEKAFTFFRRNEGTYSSISNGWMSEEFQALGSSTFSETADGSNILNWLRNELAAGKAVTFATKGAVPVGLPSASGRTPTWSSTWEHRDDTPCRSAGTSRSRCRWGTLRNPWGYERPPAATRTQSDGYVTLTGDQATPGVLWKAQSAFV